MGIDTTPNTSTIELQNFLPAKPTQNLQTLSNYKQTDLPQLLVTDINLATNQSVTAYSDAGVPDYWLISIMPNSGVRGMIYNGPQQAGLGIRIAGGGFARLPAVSEYLSVTCLLGTMTGSILAVRHYVDVILQGGQVV